MGNAQDKTPVPTHAKFTQHVQKNVNLSSKQYEILRERGRRAVQKREEKKNKIEENDIYWDKQYEKCRAIQNKKERLVFFFQLFFNTYPKLCLWKNDADKYMELWKELDQLQIENISHESFRHIITHRQKQLNRYQIDIGGHYSQTLCSMNDWLDTSKSDINNMKALISCMSGDYSEYYKFLRSVAKYNTCPTEEQIVVPNIVLDSHASHMMHAQSKKKQCHIIGGKYKGKQSSIISSTEKMVTVLVDGSEVRISKKNVRPSKIVV